MTPETPGYNPEAITNEDFDGNSLKDLKTLQKSIKDWKIDSVEAQIINEKIREISDEAKVWLKEITTQMLSNGFIPKDETGYNAFAKLIKNSWFPAIPTFSQVKIDIFNKMQANPSWWEPKDILITSEWITYKFEHYTSEPEVFNKAETSKLDKTLLDDNLADSKKFEEEFWEKYKDAHKWYKEHWDVTGSTQIKEIKDVLNNDISGEYKIIDTTGTFNREFFNAVVKYQKDNLLVEDWLVWRKTLEDMMIWKEEDWYANNKNEARDYYKVLNQKATDWYNTHDKTPNRDKIKSIQKKLWITENGIISDTFINKIKEFQEANNIEKDGLAWAKVLKELWLIDSVANSKAKAFYR